MGGVQSKSLVKEKLQEGATIVDARPKKDYDKAHVDGAINVPVGGPMSSAKADAAIAQNTSSLPDDKNAPIVTYCAIGGEAGACKRALERAGYTNVTNGGSKSAVESAKKG